MVDPAQIMTRPKKRTRTLNTDNAQDGDRVNEQSNCQHLLSKNATNSSGGQYIHKPASFASTNVKVPTKIELSVESKPSSDVMPPSPAPNVDELVVDKSCIKFIEDEEVEEVGKESQDSLSVKCVIEVLQEEYIDILYRRRVWHGYLEHALLKL